MPLPGVLRKGEERMRSKLSTVSAAILAAVLVPGAPAPPQKHPPPPLIQEGAPVSTVNPFMAVFNNLVLFDQGKPVNSLQTIVPDLAESWTWSADRKRLTFTLRQGVKWHAGKPFTSKDVGCTFDLLLGKAKEGLRLNPRQVWYHNVMNVQLDGEFEVTLELKEPPP